MLRDGDLQIKQQATGRAKGCSRRTEGWEGQTVAWAVDYSPGGRRLPLSSARSKHHILNCQTTYLSAISSHGHHSRRDDTEQPPELKTLVLGEIICCLVVSP